MSAARAYRRFAWCCCFAIIAAALVSAGHSNHTGWPMWGGAPSRNLVAFEAKNLPETWNTDTGENILWSAELGRTSYGNPVVGGGRVVVGTNNENPRDPAIRDDRGVVMCFDLKDGRFLWQDTYPKLPAGSAQDWPLQGICSSPAIDGDRVYYLNNRAQLVCSDLNGFHDGENDGPVTDEIETGQHAADICWRYDLMAELGVTPCFMAASNPLVVDDRVFVVTSNGVNPDTGKLWQPQAPSFVAIDKRTGQLLWQAGFQPPGQGLVQMHDILEGQWGSPSYGTVTSSGGTKRAQVIFPGGDGFIYALEPASGELIWKCNCNPPGVKWLPGGRGNMNYPIASPVLVDNTVYIAIGQDPEHGGGEGNLLAIDATGQGDVSATHIRWQRSGKDFGRSISTCAVYDGIVYAAELDGFLYAIDANTGEELWQHDMLAAVWGSPLVADGRVYLADEDGEAAILRVGRTLELLAEIAMPDAMYGTPVAVGDRLILSTRSELYLIGQ